MKPQCRPGDLAVVIPADPEEFNCGMVVTVLHADLNPWGYEYLWSGPTWWVRSVSPLSWFSGDQGVIRGTEGPLPDSVLYPIRGIDAAMEVEELTYDPA